MPARFYLVNKNSSKGMGGRSQSGSAFHQPVSALRQQAGEHTMVTAPIAAKTKIGDRGSRRVPVTSRARSRRKAKMRAPYAIARDDGNGRRGATGRIYR